MDCTMQPKKPRARMMATAKKPARNLPKPPVNAVRDVVDGAAVDGAVCAFTAGLDGQGGLGVDGGHAEECNDPHPEDGAGAAGQDCAGCADDVAGTDLGGNGSGQCLEGGHAAGSCFSPLRERLPNTRRMPSPK